MADQSLLATSIDIAALTLSVAAFAISLRTQRSADRWRQETDGRRPFAAELQKLQQLLVQGTLLSHDVVALRRRVLSAVAKIEAAGGGAKVADTKKALLQAQAQEPAVHSALSGNKEFIDQMWRIGNPTPQMFAELQQMVSSIEAIVAAAQADEKVMQKYLTDNPNLPV